MSRIETKGPGRWSPDARVEGSALHVPKTSEIIARWLRRELLRSRPSPGDALPSEVELRERFGVSRPTIREAVRILETQHLVRVARGASGGARFTLPEARMVSESTGIYLQAHGTTQAELNEARIAIEPRLIGFLAGRLSPEAIASLRTEIDRQAAALDDVVAYSRSHEDFYALLSALCPNRLIALELLTLRDLIQAQTELVGEAWVQALPQSREGMVRHVEVKRRVVDHLAAGEAAAAEALWTRMLEAQQRLTTELGVGDNPIEAL
ncbi:FadR/GntR family transcriptional regulator [Brevundimonas sp.]|uniref:FadR/GntR family transcriptional regulator n=1 Tax=Brevundimonas sp. TaxID=1871086 RepID=UPI002ABCC30B|nr:GntR family transcriptional regulator [Brevundimonas sp.]MDZ4365263.1 GntR family transcriptional regulator [Brevundimonas sp.]